MNAAQRLAMLKGQSQPQQAQPVVKPRVTSCIKCNGTGTWRGPQWSRTCFRCRGKGYIDAEQAGINARYDAVSGTATQRITFSSYNNPFAMA